jgi:hypothetical protein
MKAHGGMAVEVQLFSTRSFMEVSEEFHTPAALPRGKGALARLGKTLM